MPETDNERFDEVQEKLYTAVISDTLDSLGFRDQAMSADIRPVYPGATIVGRAFTALSVDVYHEYDEPYKMEIEAVDSLKEADVMVACTNKSSRTAFWGELLSTAARARGARGAIVDGYVRDVAMITHMQFPVFAAGMKPIDSKGRSVVSDYGCPIVCGDVTVNPGDIVFADVDGIVVIPKEVEEETVSKSLEKVEGENITRQELLKGAYLKDVYENYGVL